MTSPLIFLFFLFYLPNPQDIYLNAIMDDELVPFTWFALDLYSLVFKNSCDNEINRFLKMYKCEAKNIFLQFDVHLWQVEVLSLLWANNERNFHAFQ